ncbi:MAG: hypothetical protein ACLT8E_11490 [Akkermansia sp.]
MEAYRYRALPCHPAGALNCRPLKPIRGKKFQQLIDKIEATPGYTEAQIDLFIGRLYANCVEAITAPRANYGYSGKCEHAQLSSSVRLAARRIFQLWEPSLYEEVSGVKRQYSDINQSYGIL